MSRLEFACISVGVIIFGFWLYAATQDVLRLERMQANCVDMCAPFTPHIINLSGSMRCYCETLSDTLRRPPGDLQ